MNEFLLVYRSQTGSDLCRDFERQLYLKSAGALDKTLERLPLYKLHCVKVTLTGSAQVENRGNIRVTDARRRAGFAQKTKPRRFITEVSLADDFQCHGAVKIDVDRLVSHPHRTATQYDRFPVLAPLQLIMLKSLHRLFRCCKLDRILGSGRPAGLNRANKTLTEHTYRTHSSRMLVATAWTSALGLSF